MNTYEFKCPTQVVRKKKKRPLSVSSSEEDDATSVTDGEDDINRMERLTGTQEDMADVLRYRRTKYQGEVNMFIADMWRRVQGSPPDDESVWMPEGVLEEVYLRDRSLAMSQMTNEQKTAVRLYLEEVWAKIYRAMPDTHPVRARQLHLQEQHALRRETARVETGLALGMGHHERLGAGSRLQSLEPGVLQIIADMVEAEKENGDRLLGWGQGPGP